MNNQYWPTPIKKQPAPPATNTFGQRVVNNYVKPYIQRALANGPTAGYSGANWQVATSPAVQSPVAQPVPPPMEMFTNFAEMYQLPNSPVAISPAMTPVNSGGVMGNSGVIGAELISQQAAAHALQQEQNAQAVQPGPLDVEPVQVNLSGGGGAAKTAPKVAPVGGGTSKSTKTTTTTNTTPPPPGATPPTALQPMQPMQDDSMWGRAKSFFGDALGVTDTRYLLDANGNIQMTKEGVPLINADANTWTDVGAGLSSLVQTGVGAYGMFKGMNQAQHRLDTARGHLDLAKDKYNEGLRKNQAIVNQNRGA